MANPWFPFRASPSESRPRLFCLPYAGGSASLFAPWSKLLPAVEVCAVELPGRGRRIREPLLGTMDQLLAALVPALLPLTNRPYALLGHSMGAGVALAAALRLRDLGRPPGLVIASGRWGPHRQADQLVHDLPDEAFRARLAELGGTPAEVLAHRELMDLVVPIVRADMQVNDVWVWDGRAPLDCPVALYAGRDDQRCPLEATDGWEQVTRGPFRRRVFDGGHFFLTERRDEVLDALRADLAESLPFPPGGLRPSSKAQ